MSSWQQAEATTNDVPIKSTKRTLRHNISSTPWYYTARCPLSSWDLYKCGLRRMYTHTHTNTHTKCKIQMNVANPPFTVRVHLFVCTLYMFMCTYKHSPSCWQVHKQISLSSQSLLDTDTHSHTQRAMSHWNPSSFTVLESVPEIQLCSPP